MFGGLGDDYYYVDNVGDYIWETDGWDAVASEVYSYTLPTGVERLNLGENGVIGYGNTLNNLIFDYGNVGASYLYGGYGNDTLWGYTGDDFLAGEWGNDTIYGGIIPIPSRVALILIPFGGKEVLITLPTTTEVRVSIIPMAGISSRISIVGKVIRSIYPG